MSLTAEGDGLLSLIGLVDDEEGPDDGAVHHDHYLYGTPKIPQQVPEWESA